MALENPITSDDLTINFASLLDMSVSDRVQAAAADTGFAQALMASLTPIQMAKAFPDYYRKELPDISNFILANRYLDSGGRFDQRGGGDHGTAKPFYDGEAVPEGTVPRIPGQQSEVEKSKVEQILEKAGITGTATGETGVTSAIKDEKGFIISTADTSLSPAQRALLDTIAVGDPTKGGNYWESPDYNTIVNGGKFTDFSDHPRVFGTSASTAAGRYQFTKSTWDEERAKYNKKFPDNPITDFSPLNQDKLALFLAEQRYRNNTGRDLNADLANPPENMGELIKVGLGKGPVNLTWEIFTQKKAQEVGDAFDANLARNQGYLEQEIEAEAKKKEGVEKQITATPELMKRFENDEKVQKYFAENPEVANKVQEAINSGKITIDDVTSIVSKSNSAQINTSNLEDAIVNPNQSRVKEDQSQLAGTRKLPLQEDLTNTMNYTAQKISEETGRNISLQVFSGGQAALGTAGPRTGSTEHDLGGAGDVYLVETLSDGSTRRLNMRNAEDKELMYKAAYHFVRAGGRSVGLESGYMGDEAIHFGISRNNEDPTHHADERLSNIVDQARAEFVQEARENGWDERHGYKDFFKKEQEKRIAAYEQEKESAAIATPAPSDSGKTMLISAGTNDWGNKDPEVTYNNLVEMANQARAKGYTPVLIAPVGTGKFKTVNETANRVATELGVKIEQPQEYDEDGYHPTQKEAERIAGLYPGSVAVGDSIANRIGTYITDGKTYATDGIQSGVALDKLNTQVESVVTPEQAKPTVTASATPVATAEQAKPVETATATPVGPVGGPEEAPKFRTGGSPDVQDDENLSVFDEDGSLKWKMNSGEGIYVKPKDTEYADDKMDELSGRIDELDDKMGSPPPEKNQPKTAPDKAGARPDKNWQQDASTVTYSLGSQNRAFKRTKFQNEGFHFNRSAPNSISS